MIETSSLEFFVRYMELIDADPPQRVSDYEVAKANWKRNRFTDVLPNEPTRVKFDDPDKYFNANWMLGGLAIACHAPLAAEFDEFYEMLEEKDIELVISLVDPTPSGRKCSDYWTKCSGEVVFENGKERILKRKLQTSANRTVTHFHLENWPDQSVVQKESLAHLVKLVSDATKHGEKFLVHCSAGLGRTGTFLAAFEAYKKEEGDMLSIAKSIRHPETGRVGSIQTHEQYGLACETAVLLKSQPA